jgi:hypothetical protein
LFVIPAAAREARAVEGLAVKAMPVARLTLELSIEHAHSLKDRRQVVRSLKEKLRHTFNVSIAELDESRVWNRATLGIVAISASRSYIAGQMQQVEKAAHRLAAGLSAEITDSYVEMEDLSGDAE